jgi:hypothetical protein
VDPAHLSLNLRILAFTEACRTIPLPYTPAKVGSSFHAAHEADHPKKEILYDDHDPDPDSHQAALLAKAQKLYVAANMIQKPSDRVMYLKELANVGGLLAYKVPEESPTARYLSQERREAVADQINRAILCRFFLGACSAAKFTRLFSIRQDWGSSYITSRTVYPIYDDVVAASARVSCQASTSGEPTAGCQASSDRRG